MAIDDPDAVSVYGQPRPRREPIPARAGPVRFVLEDGMIKHVRLGAVELIRRVYFGVRADDWDTIYPVFSDLETDTTEATFRATWKAQCHRGPVHYQWTGTINAKADGTIHFTVSGEPVADFGSNRIGLCLLLPAQSLAGLPFTLIKPDGGEEAGTFPRYVSPELVGARFRGIRYQPPMGPAVRCDMEGAVFDMEDQRLYMDTTYKAYAPLPHAYPQARAGEAFSQTLKMRLPRGPGAVQPIETGKPVTVSLGGPVDGGRLPELGLTLARLGNNPSLTDREAAELAAMKLAHLRIEVDLKDGGCERVIANALPAVDKITRGLLISAHGVDESTLGRLASLVRVAEGSLVERLMIETCDADPKLLGAVRDAVRSEKKAVRVGGPGSADVSAHPDLAAWAAAGPDFLSWAGSPAIHQEDDETLMENTAGIGEQLAAARQYTGKIPLAMGPFRLDGAWPRPRPDARHTGLFAAAWAAAALKQLGEGGACWATLFNATGADGVLYRPESFDQPGYDGTGRRRYPVYDCIKWFSRSRGTLCPARSSDPLRLEALAVQTDGRSGEPTLVLINKSFQPQPVRLEGVSGPRAVYSFTGADNETGDPPAPGRFAGTWPGGGSSPPALTVPAYGLMWLVAGPAQ